MAGICICSASSKRRACRCSHRERQLRARPPRRCRSSGGHGSANRGLSAHCPRCRPAAIAVSQLIHQESHRTRRRTIICRSSHSPCVTACSFACGRPGRMSRMKSRGWGVPTGYAWSGRCWCWCRSSSCGADVLGGTAPEASHPSS
jgi:hypothetical protein